MEKISSQDALEVIAEVPGTIRALSAELREAREKIASYERRDQADRIVLQMADRGFEGSHHEKVAELLEDPERDLDVMEAAVRLDVPQVKLASVGDDPGTGVDPITECLLEG